MGRERRSGDKTRIQVIVRGTPVLRASKVVEERKAGARDFAARTFLQYDLGRFVLL